MASGQCRRLPRRSDEAGQSYDTCNGAVGQIWWGPVQESRIPVGSRSRVCSILPWNDDSVLVVLQLEGERVLLGVLRRRNAGAGLRLLDVLHEPEVHVQSVGVSD